MESARLLLRGALVAVSTRPSYIRSPWIGEARRVREQFGDDLVGATVTALSELSANFTDEAAQGSVAFASTMVGIHPELDLDVLANDAVAAVVAFMGALGLVGGVS